jgi:hypothetical protein
MKSITFDEIKKFPEPQITIDFSFLQHNKYGFHKINCKTQSRIFAHFMLNVKENSKYLEQTKRLNDYKEDIVLEEMVSNHPQGMFLVGKQIEHFSVVGYDTKISANAREKCESFRIFGIREGTRFFLIRIDPEHQYSGFNQNRSQVAA